MGADAGMPAPMDASVNEDAAPPEADASAPDAARSDAMAACLAEQVGAEQTILRATSDFSRSCTIAEECVFLRSTLATACSVSCSTQVASRQGRDSIEMVVSGIERSACSKFVAEGCTLQAPACAPETRTLSCVAGECVALDPGAVVTCQNMQDAAERRFQAALAELDNSCTMDRECENARLSTSCHSRCEVEPISVSSAPALLDALPRLEESCAGYLAAGCEPVVDDCSEVAPTPVCLDGRCARAAPQP
jgi:hypothetical protein